MSISGENVFTSSLGGGTSSFTYVDWTAMSPAPSFTGLGSVSSLNFLYRLEGSDLLIRGDGVCGTVAASPAAMILPAGLTLALTKIPPAQLNWLGEGQRIQPSTAQMTTIDRFILFTDHALANVVFFGAQSASSLLYKSNGSVIFGNSNRFVIDFRAPIL